MFKEFFLPRLYWLFSFIALGSMIYGIRTHSTNFVWAAIAITVLEVFVFIIASDVSIEKFSTIWDLGFLFGPIGAIALGLFIVSIATSSVICVLFTIAFATLFFILYQKSRTLAKEKPEYKPTDHGSADWSSNYKFKQNTSYETGLYIGGGFQRKKLGHLCTVAGSGQGKGTCLIIPSLLVNPHGSYVVTDPKGENAFITARFQKEAGQRVFIIDPWDEQTKLGAKHGIKASGFNPFAFIKKDMHELRDNCEQIATYLIPDNPNVKDPYWNDRAKSMIKIFLMHIVTAMPEQDHNFWTLYKMLRKSGDDWLNLLIDLKMNTAEDGLISIAAEELIGIEKAGNTMAGIRSSAQNATTIFESPQIKKSLIEDNFDPYSLTDGNCTVYVVIPERYLDTHAVWLRLVIGLSLKACNAKPNKRVNFLLDEFAVMGKMKDVQRGFAFARGQNIVLWIFIQTLSQLKDNYGEDGMNTFISNSAIFQAFGIKDQYSTEYVSKLLGESTHETVSKSTSEGGSHSTYSTSTSKHGRRLLTADEVETTPEIITIGEGLRFKIQRLPYFRSQYSGSDAEILKQRQQNKLHGYVEWYEKGFLIRADPPPRINH